MPLEAVQRAVEQEQVEHTRGSFGDLRIRRVVDEQAQRRDVLLVVHRRQPLRESEPEPQPEPVHQPSACVVAVLRSRTAVVAERLLAVRGAGEVLGGREQQLVVLRPEAHRVVAGFCHPVLEADQRALDLLLRGLGDLAPQHDREQRDGPEVGAVAPRVDERAQLAQLRGQCVLTDRRRTTSGGQQGGERSVRADDRPFEPDPRGQRRLDTHSTSATSPSFRVNLSNRIPVQTVLPDREVKRS